jgi:signal transduction histidine kinase/ActR/RegA family two-component response regulator
MTEAVKNASRTGLGVGSFVDDLLLRGKSIIVFKAVYQGRYAPNSEKERMDMFNGAIAIETGTENLLSDIIPSTENISITLKHKYSENDQRFGYAFNNKSDSTSMPSILPLLSYRHSIDLYGLPTELVITQKIRLSDIHFYWVLLTVFSCLIIYIAMLSTWHNLKIARLHEQELEGYAARAAFSEENTDPIMRISHDGMLLYSNEPGQKITENWKTTVGSHAPNNIKDFVRNVLQTNEYQEIETSIGSTHFTLRFVPRRAQNYVNVYGRDDTEQKQAELALLEAKQAAEAANIAKSRFLATISHEVRTPMNGVLGMLELLLKTQLSDKQRGFAKNALRSGKSLLGLINDILDFSKIESSKLKLERAPFNIKDTIDDVIQLVEEDAKKKNLNLITELPEIDYQIVGDQQRLRQILINLVGNAVKFTEQGDIIVRMTKTAEYKSGVQLKFEISDTGIGIKPEALPFIFNDFTQQDDSTTRKFGGTGLGLAITKQLVNMMGGEIFVQSKPNEGSSFWITMQFEIQLPEPHIADSQVDYTPESSDVQDEEVMVHARILLAEDNAINQEVASAMLESVGCEIVAVENGEQALQALQDSRFDLVLMDCQMPTMDGFKATRKLRQLHTNYSQIPIIALTADIQQGIVQQCRQAGMDDYLSKPFTHESLVEMVVKWLPRQAYREA